MKRITVILLLVTMLLSGFFACGPSGIAAPEFSVPAGEVASKSTVTITCKTADAKIYYTLDGTKPNDTKEEYGDPVMLEGNSGDEKTLRAIAVKGSEQSEETKAVYKIK